MGRNNGGGRVCVTQQRMSSVRGAPGRGWRLRQAAPSSASARPGRRRRTLHGMGKLQEQRARPLAVRLDRRIWIPVGELRLGQHSRGMEGELRR